MNKQKFIEKLNLKKVENNKYHCTLPLVSKEALEKFITENPIPFHTITVEKIKGSKLGFDYCITMKENYSTDNLRKVFNDDFKLFCASYSLIKNSKLSDNMYHRFLNIRNNYIIDNFSDIVILNHYVYINDELETILLNRFSFKANPNTTFILPYHIMCGITPNFSKIDNSKLVATHKYINQNKFDDLANVILDNLK